jgi:hypothetical protein
LKERGGQLEAFKNIQNEKQIGDHHKNRHHAEIANCYKQLHAESGACTNYSAMGCPAVAGPVCSMFVQEVAEIARAAGHA